MSGTIETFVLPCQASTLLGQLKHTYLTNKICLKALPEDLLESMLYDEDGIPEHQHIRNRIGELLEAISSSDRGFSPAQLIDQLGPLRASSNDKRDRLKAQIHARFSEDFGLLERKARLESLSEKLLFELDNFLNLPSAMLAMERVQEAARALIHELESLPKGIWLWKTVKAQ